MPVWLDLLTIDPLPTLIAIPGPALQWHIQRDLLGNVVPPAETLWDLPEPVRILRRQLPNGSWPYPAKSRRDVTYMNYNLLETFRQLGILVQKYAFDKNHPAIASAAEYVLSCQTEAGDLRGILGSQSMPYYHGMLLAWLIEAGYGGDDRILLGLDWLAGVRQDDGGWVVPLQTVKGRKYPDIFLADPVVADRQAPSSHLATGMALRAFAVHFTRCRDSVAYEAGNLLKKRLFFSEPYNDRRTPQYWLKFQYPYWWTNLLTALDSLSNLGFSAEDIDVQRGLDWFLRHQESDGLWPTGYGASKDPAVRGWIGLAICRLLACLAKKRLF